MALQYDKILMFGDSITQDSFRQEFGFCMGSALQNAYARKFDVIARGFGGYNSDHGVLMVDKILEHTHTADSKVKLMIIFFGSNDSVMPSAAQYVPIPKFKENLRKISNAARKLDIPIILVGPAPFNWHAWTAARPTQSYERTTFRQRDYCDAVADVAKEFKVPVAKLWYDIMEEIGWKEGAEGPVAGEETGPNKNALDPYFYDGLHFSGPAAKVHFESVMKQIQENYPALDPENVKRKLPQWNELSSTPGWEKEL